MGKNYFRIFSVIIMLLGFAGASISYKMIDEYFFTDFQSILATIIKCDYRTTTKSSADVTYEYYVNGQRYEYIKKYINKNGMPLQLSEGDTNYLYYDIENPSKIQKKSFYLDDITLASGISIAFIVTGFGFLYLTFKETDIVQIVGLIFSVVGLTFIPTIIADMYVTSGIEAKISGVFGLIIVLFFFFIGIKLMFPSKTDRL